jgi:viroplasmin and RNaseH domain-containing protein
MELKRAKNAKEVIKSGAGETTPLGADDGYYAVANGKDPGIYPRY